MTPAVELPLPLDAVPVVPFVHDEDVPPIRRCPICWGMHKGRGNSTGNDKKYRGRKRYYKCIVCKHSWVAILSNPN